MKSAFFVSENKRNSKIVKIPKILPFIDFFEQHIIQPYYESKQSIYESVLQHILKPYFFCVNFHNLFLIRKN
jgi:hypothetical protein